MNVVATVLYEDKMQVGGGGAFPPHDLVLAMVGDALGETVWALRSLVEKNPRNGISKLLADVKRRTALIAGAGRLCILVDGDRVAEHVGLPKHSPEGTITEKLRELSDAGDKLEVFYLRPNLEGLLRSIEECAPAHPAPVAKKHAARDTYLNKAAFSLPMSVRDCVRAKQPGVAGLVDTLVGLCRTAE